MVSRVYLDNNATTAVDPEVVSVVSALMSDGPLNPSSSHAPGRRAALIFDRSLARMAEMVGARPEEIYVTSGGTESNNLAMFGCVAGRPGRGGHVVLSSIEHSSVHEAGRRLAEAGIQVSSVPPDSSGFVDPAAMAAALRPDTILASLMLVNNETGVVQDVAALSGLARASGTMVHCDAVQAAGKMPIDVNVLGVDMLSVSGHKFHGPQGTGFLYVREGCRIRPFMAGGPQQSGVRPGTQNVAGAAGLARACDLAAARLADDRERVASLRDSFEHKLLQTLGGVSINGIIRSRVCNTSSLTLQGVDASVLLAVLDLEGIAVSAGSACAALGGAHSHVLGAMGLSVEDAASTIRVSFGRDNTPGDVEICVGALRRAVTRLRGHR